MAVAPPVPGRQAYFRLFRSSVTVYSYPGRTTSIPPSAEAYAHAYAVWGHARPPRTYSSTHAAMPCVSTVYTSTVKTQYTLRYSYIVTAERLYYTPYTVELSYAGCL